MMAWVDRTSVPSWGQQGGLSGTVNGVTVIDPSGHVRHYGKATNVKLLAGSLVEDRIGGGGGYGPPEERDPKLVHNDIREGYLTEAQARLVYPQAFVASSTAPADGGAHAVAISR